MLQLSHPEEELDNIMEDVLSLDESPTEAESDDDHDDHYVESNDDPDWADLEDSAASGEESGEEDPLDAKPRNNVRYRK